MRHRGSEAVWSPRRAWGALSLSVLLIGHPVPVHAEALVRLRRQGGELGGAIESLAARDAFVSQAEPPRTQFWLRVPLEGVVVSPRVFAWMGAVRPSFQRGPAGGGGTVRFHELGHEFSARAFAGSPLMLGAFTTRTRGRSQREGVTLSEFDAHTASVQSHLRLRGIAVRAEWRESHSEQQWVIGPLAEAVTQDLRTRTWRVEAANSRLQMWRQGEHRIGPGTATEYRTWSSGATHTLRWGHGSEIATRFTRDEQARPDRTGQWEWEERVRLRHSTRTESAWSREERHAWNPMGGSRAVGWSGRLSDRVADGVRWGAAYQERRAGAGGERAITRSGGPELALSGRLPGAVRFDLTTGIDLERRRIAGETRNAVDVLEDRLLFDASGSIMLLRAGIRVSTLRLESPDHALLFLEGVDYRALPGNSTLQLLLVPGGRLRAGDAVLASYTYDPAATGSASAQVVRVHALMSWRGLSLRHARRRRTVDGSGIAVTARTSDYDEDESALELEKTARLGRVHACAALTHRGFGGFRQQVTELRGEWSGRPTAWGQPSAAVGRSRRTGEAEALELDDIALGWTASPFAGLTTVARLEGRWSRLGTAHEERFTGMTIDADWRYGALETQLRYGYAARRDGVDRDAQRVWLRLTRRF